MNTHLWKPLSLIPALLLAGACGGSPDNPGSGTAAERTINVRVQELRPSKFTETLQLTGTLKALEDVTISPEEGGTVKSWLFDRGAFIEQGAVIALLNDDVVKPGYDAAVAQYNTTELNYRKQEKVFEEQAVSEWTVKSSEFARDGAKAQAEMMKARYERTRIKSPVAGILEDRFVDEGEMASPGMPLARVVNVAAMKISINVPERYSGSTRRGTSVEFTVLAYPGETFRGTVTFVGSAISPDNRTFVVEATTPNRGRKLKPEMIARVDLLQTSRPEALLVPEEIIQQLDRGKHVVYVEEGGRARERAVLQGGRQGNLVDIVEGLKAGDHIIVSGFQNLVDGQSVVVTR